MAAPPHAAGKSRRRSVTQMSHRHINAGAFHARSSTATICPDFAPRFGLKQGVQMVPVAWWDFPIYWHPAIIQLIAIRH
jgi:hypothetical protein